jgi:choline kinase
LVPVSSNFKVAIPKLGKCKLPESDQIPAVLIQAGGKTLLLQSTNSLIPIGIRKNFLISGSS